jgi:hypothetical protein
VPVSLSTAGHLTVSPLAGLRARSGTYVSTIEAVLTKTDVFAHTAGTDLVGSAGLVADYDIVQMLDLAPGRVYFVYLYASCNFTLKGTWACNGHATASFHLDQAKFDERMGANSFDLSQYYVVQQSPNIVPEPGAALLGLGALGALVGCARQRQRSRRCLD